MRTTVVDVRAKLMVTNGVGHIIDTNGASMSIHTWLKRFMEEFPAGHYECVIGDQVVLELNSGEFGRTDLTKEIIELFNKHRMNFGEELRLRLITISHITQPITKNYNTVTVNSNISPSSQEIFSITRMNRPDLESIVDQALTQDSWKAVIAYCELERRQRTVAPTWKNSIMMLSKSKGHDDISSYINQILNQLGHPDYLTLLKAINDSNNKPNNSNTNVVQPSSSNSPSVEPLKKKKSGGWWDKKTKTQKTLIFTGVALFAILGAVLDDTPPPCNCVDILSVPTEKVGIGMPLPIQSLSNEDYALYKRCYDAYAGPATAILKCAGK